MTSVNNLYNPKSAWNNKGIDLFSFGFFILFLLSLVLSTVAFENKVQQLYFLFIIVLYPAIILLESYLVKRTDYSIYLAIPVFISATQNIYLGIIAPYATSGQIQFMVITNFLFSIALLVVVFLSTPYRLKQPLYSRMVYILVALIVYSFATMVLFHGQITSSLASFRNIINPFMYFFLGLLASVKFNFKRYLTYISYLSMFVVIFGIIERFINRNIWITINLAELWTKKGLPVSASLGVPGNFYSSEMVNGEQVRRMVSSFADPVNLGTFLFFGFMACWFLKKRVMSLMIIACTVLAVSKGAFLGLLVFCVVWAYYKLSKTNFTLILISSITAGIGFILYSFANSTMSMLLHVTGFFASLTELIHHPLGRGLGNIGVLAGLYSQGAETNITESGLGMVIGQLGVVGLILYVYFFMFVNKQFNRIMDIREKILAKSLLFSIILNVMFNEVALSPNSSAVYFIALGGLVGYWSWKTNDVPQLKIKKKRRKIVW